MGIRSNSELLGDFRITSFACVSRSLANACIENHIENRFSTLQAHEKRFFQEMLGKKAEDLAAVKETMGNYLIAHDICFWAGIALSTAFVFLMVFTLAIPAAFASGVLIPGMLACGVMGTLAFAPKIICFARFVSIFEKHIQEFLIDSIRHRKESERDYLLNPID